jgi:hypothetical protein
MDPAQKFGATFLRAGFGDKNTAKECGAPERIRTTNLLIRSQMLYPVELRALCLGEPVIGKDFDCHFYGALLRSPKMKDYATH